MFTDNCFFCYVFNRFFHSNVPISEFFGIFEKFMSERRSNERDQDFITRDVVLDPSSKSNSLLRSAASIYTPNLFKLVSLEFGKCWGIQIHDKDVREKYGEYIAIDKHGELTRQYSLKVDFEDIFFQCSCRLFQNMGIMCRHSYALIFILHAYGLRSSDTFEKIPPRHVLSRWTRDAKKGLTSFTASDSHQPENLRNLCASFKVLASYACQDPMRFQHFLEQYNDFYNKNKPVSNSDVIPGMFTAIFFLVMYCSYYFVFEFFFYFQKHKFH